MKQKNTLTTRKELLDFVRALDYDGDAELASVKSWMSENGVELRNKKGKSVNIDEIWNKTVYVQADTAGEVEMLPALDEAETEAEDGEEEEDDEEAKAASLHAENTKLKAQLARATGSRGGPHSRANYAANLKGGVGRNASIRAMRAKAYNRNAQAVDSYGRSKTIWNDADEMEIANACMRLKIAQECPRFSEYSSRNEDEDIVTKALGSFPAGRGGALIPDEFMATLISNFEKYGVAPQVVNWTPMTRDTLQMPKQTSEVSIALIGENPSSVTAQNNPTTASVNLAARKVGGLIQISAELMHDSAISVGDMISESFARSFAGFEEQAMFNGTGLTTDGGIVGLKGTITGGTQASAYTIGTDWSSPTDDDLGAIVAKIPEYAAANAAWVCSRGFFYTFINPAITSSGGTTVDSMRGPQSYQALGYPVYISQKMPQSDSAGNECYFGDFNAAITAGYVNTGVEVAFSDQRYFDTDQIAARGLERIDISVHDCDSTSVVGPVIAVYTT